MAKKKKDIIKRQPFLNVLKQIHLGGVIEECEVVVEKGKINIEAVDISNSLIAISRGTRALPKGEELRLGLGNLEILTKFMSSFDDNILYKNRETAIMLKRKDGRRKLNYLLTQPEMIATRLRTEEDDEDDDPLEKIEEMTNYVAELTPTLIKDYLSYIAMVNTKDATLSYDGETVNFTCGAEDDHQFSLELSSDVSTTGDEEEPCQIKINGEHLAKIFGVLEYDEDEPPTIHFNEDVPVLIMSQTCSWALIPVTELDED